MDKIIAKIILLHVILHISAEAFKVNQNGCDGVDYFPDENDCTVFYRCVDYNTYSIVYRFTCGPGTVFDTRTNNCNFPYASGRQECKSSTQHHDSYETNASKNELENISENNNNNNNNNKNNSSSNNKNNNNKKDFICENEGFFASPADCQQFFRCVDFGQGSLVKYSFFCGEGTVWNQELLTCVHSSEASNSACSSNVHGSEVETTTSNSIISSSKPQSNKPTISNAYITEGTTSKPQSSTETSLNDNSTTTSLISDSDSNPHVSNTTDNSISQTTSDTVSTDSPLTQTTSDRDRNTSTTVATANDFENNDTTMTTTITSVTENISSTTLAQNENSTLHEDLDVTSIATVMTTLSSSNNFSETTTGSIDLTTKYSDNETIINDASTPLPDSLTISTVSAVDSQSTTFSSQTDIQDSHSTTEISSLVSTESATDNQTDTTTMTMLSTTVSNENDFNSTLPNFTTLYTTTHNNLQTTTEINPVDMDNVLTTQLSESSSETPDNYQLTTITMSSDTETTTHLKDSNETGISTTDAVSTDSSLTPSSYLTTTTESMQSPMSLSLDSSDVTDSNTDTTTENNNMMSKLSTTTSLPMTSTIASCPMTNNNSCPIINENQMHLICPTGFKRHPKYCNVYYQCTISQNKLDFQVMSFVCSEGTIFDEDKVQCLPENESQMKCESTTYKKFSRSNSKHLQMNTLFGTEPICPAVGYSAIKDDSDCTNFFVKCKKSSDKTNKKLEGYLYQCPDGFVFWKVSRRCEPSTKIPECKTRTVSMLKSQLPVETENISRK